MTKKQLAIQSIEAQLQALYLSMQMLASECDEDEMIMLTSVVSHLNRTIRFFGMFRHAKYIKK